VAVPSEAGERGSHERGIDTFYFPATVSPTQLKTSQQADVLSGCPWLEVAAQDSRVPYHAGSFSSPKGNDSTWKAPEAR